MPSLSSSRRRTAVLTVLAMLAAAAALLPPVGSGPTSAAPAGTVHRPDLRTVIPLDSLSVVGTGADREFRYTHLVFNAGDGPLRIKPFYRSSAGTYLGHQQLATHDSQGTWSVSSSRRVADAFRYHAEHGHFHFPLASFGLYRVASGGGFGAPVTMSPKVGFCIADSYIYDQSLEHAGEGHELWGNCADPTTMRGISVGGADEYDYRDPGQSVPLAGVRNGTYWFRAISDPHNDFLESDETNNEVAVKVTISGSSVAAGEVRRPDTTPCTARLTAPLEHTTHRDGVRLAAHTSASGATVRYLVDGRTVGRSSSASTSYSSTWSSISVADGLHWIAAQVTTRGGRLCTSPVTQVTVDNARGPDHTGPLVRFADPEAGSTVSGRVAIAASAADSSGVSRVVFRLDGRRLGEPRRHPPYTLIWNSRNAERGLHRLGARAVDRRGNASRTSIRVNVRHVPPPRPITVDASVVARGRDSVTTPAITTRDAQEILLALVSYDGPSNARSQSASVSGAGLGWHLVKRSDSQAGVSEIWAARTSRRLHDRTVTATPTAGGFDGMLSVFAFRNARGVGVASAAGAPTGAPDFYVPAVSEGSWVFAAGNDWDDAVARTPVDGQQLRRQWLDRAAGDTFWVQAPVRPTTIHRLITIRDTAPTDHRWNYVGAEVLAALGN